MLQVTLKPGRDKAVRRRHPWLLSGAIAQVEGESVDSAPQAHWAQVLSAKGETLGFGHYSPNSTIRLRMLSFGPQEADNSLIFERIDQAIDRRAEIVSGAATDGVRLVNAEGDGLPGLVVDRYGDVVVVRMTSSGMVRLRSEIAERLQERTGAPMGYERADQHALRREGLPIFEGPLWGEAPEKPVVIHEGTRVYQVDVVAGQKTGFYLDQRDARDLVQSLSPGRRVLDLFCYTGGFSVAAALGDASSVVGVDSSKGALARAELNLTVNGRAGNANFERADGFEFLRAAAAAGQQWDILLLDPPPLARRKGDVQAATRAYKDMLMHGFRCASPGAHVLAWSCSHHVGPDLFKKVIFGAAVDVERDVRVVGTLGAPADHPVSIYHPEGHYLSGWHLQL